MPEEVDGWIEREAHATRSANQRSRRAIEAKKDRPGVDPRGHWMRAVVQEDDRTPVEPHPPEGYQLPRGIVRCLPSGLVERLQRELELVREVNEELVGLPILEAQVVLSRDPRVPAAMERLQRWADDCVEVRVTKPNPKDQSDPFARFLRIYDELVPALEAIAFRKGSCHRCFLADMTDYIPWLLFQRTWSGYLDRDFPPGALRNRFRVLFPDPQLRYHAQQLVLLYGWSSSDDLHLALDKVPLPAEPRSPEEVQTHIENLIEDIQEMRPFLMRNFNPERTLVEVAPGLFATWRWNVGAGPGLISVAGSREELLSYIKKSHWGAVFLLRDDGWLACSALPWVHVGTEFGERPNLPEASARIVDCIHEALWSCYEKIDVPAILADWKARHAAAPTVQPTDEEVAASCQAVAEEDAEPVPRGRQRIPSIRSQRLFSILEDRLGCEVRQGKGSEVVVYRAGGRHFRLGHHRRNTHVPSLVIKDLLDRVGVSFEEWLGAVS